MSLARKLEKVLELDDVSNFTKDIALKEIIENYRKFAATTKESYEDKRYNPIIEEVIAGKTTYMKEFNRLGATDFALTGNSNIVAGNFEMEKSINLVDETIKRLYIK